MSRAAQRGFTLIEIMAALAILGMSLFILLNSHYSAMRLHETTAREALMREMVERTMGYAETQVLAGALSEQGDFGVRYGEEFSWSFEAKLVGEDELVQLYEIQITVNGPEEAEKSISFLAYNPSAEVLGEGGDAAGSSRNRSRGSNATDRGSSRSSGSSRNATSGSSRSSTSGSSRGSTSGSSRSSGRGGMFR